MKSLEQAKAKLDDLMRQREKSQARLKRLRLDAARLSKEQRRLRTHKLCVIGAECEKLVPGLSQEGITNDEIKALLEQALASEKH